MKKRLIACFLAALMSMTFLFSASALGEIRLEINPEAQEGIESPDTHYWYMIGDDLAAEFLSMNNNVTKVFIATKDGEAVADAVFQYKAVDADDDAYADGTPRMIGNYVVRAKAGDAVSENTHGYRVEAPKVMILNDTYESLYAPELARTAEYAENIVLEHERTETMEEKISYTVKVTGTLKAIDAARAGQESGTYFFPWQVKDVAKEDIAITGTEIIANGVSDAKEGMDAFIRQELFKIGDMVIADPFLCGVLPVDEVAGLEIVIHYENAPDLVYTFDLSGLTLE